MALKNRDIYLIVGLLLVCGGFVMAYNSIIPNPGIGGDKILVSVDGFKMTLQEAIDYGVLVEGVSATRSYTTQVPDLGHSADEIYVSISGSGKTLQQAISTSLCGSGSYSYSSNIDLGHSADEVWISVGGVEMTLQDAINSGKLVSVNGGWSVWSAWSACSVSCGGGIQTRIRTCNNPASFCQGASCVGVSSESRSCNTQSCCVSNYGGSCGGSACVNSGTVACNGACVGVSNKPAGTSCGDEYQCNGNGNCVDMWAGFSPSYVSGDLGPQYYGWARPYSATAETRMYNGIRQVRIAQCHVMGGDCTTGWSNDVASCKTYVQDVWQYGCLVTVTDKYEAKLDIGNLYGDVPVEPFATKIFGPGFYVPSGVKGKHEGGYYLGRGGVGKNGKYLSSYDYDTTCVSKGWPGLTSCACATGYRSVYRLDLFQRAGYDGYNPVGYVDSDDGPGYSEYIDYIRKYHYDCVKN